MNLLVTKAPALVLPYDREREQPMRVDKIKDYLPMQTLKTADLQPAGLSRHIAHMLEQRRAVDTVPLNLDGAANAARIIEGWAGPGRNDSRPGLPPQV